MQQDDWVLQVALRDGAPITVRPLQAEDVEPLAAFFQGLSAETRRRYAPHPFDHQTAAQLCSSIDADPCTRFVVVLEDGRVLPAVIGYLILNPELSANDQQRYLGYVQPGLCAGIAPAVADAYQRQGVGALLAGYVIGCARNMGLRQLVLSGGVRAFNESALRFYEKLGFRQVGEFWTRDPDLTLNYAMLLDL